ncbi:ABC transporter substrate-binding protein [Microbacterium sp. A84]|uniref:ABC transporter substrate-binding protein n=1 Tax=Microbacterium sp. A84 TaxID=3450715 RepID=UPI003F440DFB
MHLSRKLSASLLAGSLVATLALTGCSAASEEIDPDQPVTLSFLNWQWGEGTRGENLWAAVEGYSDKHENVTLEQRQTPYGQYMDKLATEFGAGNAPDVVIVLESQFAVLADAGLLEPLDDIESNLTGLNNTNDAGVYYDDRYGFSWERPNYALSWNTTLLEEAGVEPPTNFDEFYEAVVAVTEKTGKYGFAGRHQSADIDGWTFEFSNWLYGAGGAIAKDGEFQADAPENILAVERFKKIYDSGAMPIGDDASTFRSKFGEGQVAFIMDNAGTLTSQTQSGAAISGELVDASALPFEFPGSHMQLIIAVNAKSPNKAVAKDFVQWVMSAEGQEAIRPDHAASTIGTDVASPEEFLSVNPWADAFIEAAKTSEPSVVEGYEVDSRAIWRVFLSGVERVLIEDADPAATLAEVQDDLVKEFSK